MKKLMLIVAAAALAIGTTGCIHTQVDYDIDGKHKVRFDRIAFLNATKIPTLRINPATGIIEVLDYDSDGGAAGIDKLSTLTEKIAEGIATGIVKGAK